VAEAGRFITLEGGEGAGKSTQCRRLADRLARCGLSVLSTREPGGAPGAERLRALLLDRDAAWSPLAETLLHFAARAEHVERTIRPALAAGRWVVCDRFFDSTMAYQGYGLGGDRAAIAALTEMVGIRPDLTLVLDVSVPTSLARLRDRGGEIDRYEKLGEGFFQRVRNGFHAIAEADPARCTMLDAEASEDEVAERVWEAVVERFPMFLTTAPHAPSPALAGEGRGGGHSVTVARKLRQLSTSSERRLWSRLRDHQLGWHFRRQHPIPPYVLDFACVDLRVGVEADGGQRADNQADRVRDAYLTDRGWLMLRFWNNEILQNIDGVLTVITDACRQRDPHPDRPPLTRERGRSDT
jgi:dTMP kinase